MTSRKVVMIGMAVAFALILVNPSISPISALNTKSCTTSIGFKYYSKTGVADSVKNSQMMAIGTMSNVETKVVDYYTPTLRGAKNSSDIQYVRADAAPWRVVTFDVEKYLFDKTGKYSERITFRTPSNECVDKFGLVSTDSDYVLGMSPEFVKGDRALIEITEINNGELYSLGGYKIDLSGDMVETNEKIGFGKPISVHALETEIMDVIEKQ